MNYPIRGKKLPRSFYTRDVLTVARELPGKILIKKDSDVTYAGRIVETEAYDGSIDEAAHTYGGITKRNSVMFGKGGYFYVYFTYGSHYCCNVVTGTAGHGTAVLIRALEPLSGIKEMTINRYGKEEASEKERFNLTSGPGKVCSALRINKEHYGEDLTGDKIYLIDRPKIEDEQIVTAKRIGISKSVDLQWRFYIKDNPYISRK